jgi:hypothetical protein
MPFCLQRMITETRDKGFSLSSTTVPETNADFFWGKARTVSSMQIVVRNIWRLVLFIRESETRYELNLTAEIRRRRVIFLNKECHFE